MKKIILLLLLAANVSFLYSQTTLYQENFNGAVTGWTVVDGGTSIDTWGIYLGGANSLDGTDYAAVNSALITEDFDEEFISPSLATNGYSTVLLEFDQYFASWTTEIAEVDVWDGTTWQTVLSQSGTTVGGWDPNTDHQIINITAHQNPNMQVRFHYYNANDDWLWAIDNFEIIVTGTPPCPIVGFYTDNTTAYPIMDKQPLSAISPVTCEDTFFLQSFDSTDANGYVKPGWKLNIQTDANSVTENSLEVYIDGGSIGGFGPGVTPNNGDVPASSNWTVYSSGFWSAESQYDFEWCDNVWTGTFDYELYDNALLLTPVQSGTFTHGSSECTTLHLDSLFGVATFSGPGIFDYGDGQAVFIAANAGIGTHNITYCWDNENGCVDCETQQITVVNPYSAAWSAPAPMCANDASIDLNTLVTGDLGGTWSGTGVSGSTFDPSTAGAGTHSITYTYDPGGACEISESHNITVYGLPTATANDNGPVCVGESLSLTGGANGLSGYAWAGPNSFSSSSQSPIVSGSATTAMTGTYTITVTDPNGCTNTTTTSVTVNTLPTATANNNSPVCVGETLSLTGGNNGFSSYNWTGPNSYSSSAQSPTVSSSATTAMGGNYTITVTDVNGCTSTATTSVTINTLPTASAGSNSPVCVGESLSLTGGANGFSSYNWSGPNSFSSSAQSPTVSGAATTAMGGTYTITVVDGNGCSSTASTNVTVNTLPSASATSNSPVCVGESLSLTVE